MVVAGGALVDGVVEGRVVVDGDGVAALELAGEVEADDVGDGLHVAPFAALAAQVDGERHREDPRGASPSGG